MCQYVAGSLSLLILLFCTKNIMQDHTTTTAATSRTFVPYAKGSQLAKHIGFLQSLDCEVERNLTEDELDCARNGFAFAKKAKNADGTLKFGTDASQVEIGEGVFKYTLWDNTSNTGYELAIRPLKTVTKGSLTVIRKTVHLF